MTIRAGSDRAPSRAAIRGKTAEPVGLLVEERIGDIHQDVAWTIANLIGQYGQQDPVRLLIAKDKRRLGKYPASRSKACADFSSDMSGYNSIAQLLGEMSCMAIY